MVLIDTQLPDVAVLEQAVSPAAKLFLYNGSQESADQVISSVVTWAESTNTDVRSLSILSHGGPGTFELGDQWISTSTLAQTTADWSELRQVLAAEATINVFGCNVAAPGSSGQLLIDQIARLTGASVFANTTLTGYGGDWLLKASSAATATLPAGPPSSLNLQVLDTYGGTLAAITKDNTSSAATSSAGATSLTWSHTVGSGSNRILIVDISTRHSDAVTSVTYDGLALQLIGAEGDVGNEAHIEMWDLVAPPVGTGNIVVALNSSQTISAGAVDFFGVNQSTPLGTFASAEPTTATPSVIVSSAPGDLVIDAVAIQASETLTGPGSGQTQLWNYSTGTGSNDCVGGGSTAPGAASVTMSWTASGSANTAIGAVSLIAAPATGSVSGTVYEDVAGTGTLTGALPVNGATVLLYLDNGDGIPDAADTLVATTTTNASGQYSFSALPNGTYWVVVDSKTVASNEPFNAGYGQGNVWAVQTYGAAGSVTDYGSYAFTSTAGPLFGGMNGNVSDNAAALATSEDVARAVVNGGSVSGVNYGFSFNVVTNTSDGASVQGSFRQFLENADALDATHAMRFVPTVPTNASGSGGAWWEISVTSPLPAITQANTTINGTAYSTADGVTIVDPNPGQVGAGGTVGVDGLTLDEVSRPVLELTGNNAFAGEGLEVDAGDVTISGLAVNGFGTDGSGGTYDGAQIRVDPAVTAAAGQAVITGNLVGTHADGTNAGLLEYVGIWTDGAASISNNYIAYITGNGVMMSDAYLGDTNLQPVSFVDNEVAFTNYFDTNDAVSDISNGALVEGNYIHGYVGTPTPQADLGKGIEIWYQVHNALIEDNTIADMLTAGIGISNGSDNNVICDNIITGITGKNGEGGVGVLLTSFDDTASSPPVGNLITENSIYGNTGLGINIDTSTVESAPIGNSVTPNSGAENPAVANDAMNFPVITTAYLGGNTLSLAGYVGSAPNQAAFANARVEFFLSDNNASGYGSGQTYLGYLTTNANGNFSGALTVSGLAVGDKITATATDPSNNTSEFSANFQVTNPAPTVAVPASASPSPVNGTTTNLSVLGAYAGGESNLTYTWSETAEPPGATDPTYSANGTNAAKNTTATFYDAGNYTFLVTISDGTQATTSSVNVTVNQTLTSITVAPASVTLNEYLTQQFSATALDQFGNSLASQPAFTWSLASGIGSLDASGLYTAPAATGSAVVNAASGSVNGNGSVTVTDSAPTVAVAASASPSPVNGTTTNLSVLGAYAGGESNLTYTWTETAEPPGATDPTYSANDTNAAKNTTATFYDAGNYTFLVTISDGTQATTSSVNVTVNQTLTSITVAPASVTLNEYLTQQFSATALDQFGNSLASQPAFTWSLASGIGSLDATGLYTAPSATGSAVVNAASGSVNGTGSVTVTDTAPTVATAASASPSPVNGTTTNLSVLGAYAGGESNLTYTWTETAEPPGATDPTYSANGTNAAKNTTATFYDAGNYTFLVTISDGTQATTTSVNVTVNQTLTSITVAPASATLNEYLTQQFTATALDQFGNSLASQPAFTWSLASGVGSLDASGLYTAPAATGSAVVNAASGSVNGTGSVTVTDSAPTVAVPASASPSPVNGTTTNLSVLGAYAGGESNLTYTWSETAEPPGATDPTYSANGTNAAKNTTATFYDAGNYTFLVTISDGTLATTSSVNVTVNQTLTSITVAPASATLNEYLTQQFTATALDQFGNSLASQPAFTWSLASGIGSLDASGLYTAPSATGSAVVNAASGSVNGTGSVTVTDSAPTVAVAASASPSPVNGTTTNLSVLGAYVGGEPNLTYTWSETAEPPGATDPTYSANGTNAAKNATATFYEAGNYTFLVTISDGTQSTTSSVNVTVKQTLTSITVAPASATLNEYLTQQFTATALDQFGNSLASQPAFTWSLASGIGSLDAAGLYTAPAATGSAVVNAASGSVNGNGSVTVTDSAPTVATAASTSPSPVNGTTTNLSVLGAYAGGESNLTYTWTETAEPPGATDPTYSANGTNAAKNTTATFYDAGNYTFLVTISDGTQSTTSSVNVTVNQTLTSITVAPASVTLDETQTQQFNATALDQFGISLVSQPAFSWSVASGVGAVDASGLYTAPAATGSAIVNAASGSVSGNGSVTVLHAAPVLSGSNNLAAINENDTANNGTLVSDLIAGNVTDTNHGESFGIAVTAVDNTNGAWQYSTDGGSTWTAFGTPSPAAARLLAADAGTRVRFVPNADWFGTVAGGLVFRAGTRPAGRPAPRPT